MSPSYLARLTERDPHAAPRAQAAIAVDVPDVVVHPELRRLTDELVVRDMWDVQPMLLLLCLRQAGVVVPDLDYPDIELAPARPHAAHLVNPRLDDPLVRLVAANATRWSELPKHRAITAVEVACEVLGVDVKAVWS